MITERQFNAYRRVQYSGVTNMYDVRRVSQFSGILTEEHCNEIMEHYGELEKKYGNDKKAVS